MRYVIAHGHMFKNAGTTFDTALEKAFGDGFVDHRDDGAMRSGGADYLKDYLLDNPHVNAISSHHLCSPLPVSDQFKCLGVYFFRDPIERVISVYNFEKQQQPVATPGAKMAKELDLVEYVRWRLQENVAPTIRNFQTLFVSRGGLWKPGAEANQVDLGKAIQKLMDEHVFFASVDDFDRGFEYLSKEFTKYFPQTNFKYVIQNSLAGTDSEKKRKNAYRLLQPVLPELVMANAFDIALYQFARAELASKIR